MKTTKYDAIKFYEIGKYIDPYGVCDLDKDDIVKNMTELDFDENLEQLQDFICETYDSTRNLLEDEKVMRLYLNIIQRRKKNGK